MLIICSWRRSSRTWLENPLPTLAGSRDPDPNQEIWVQKDDATNNRGDSNKMWEDSDDQAPY
jgi:hypothetical protein